MKISARNVFKDKVKAITEGAVNDEVIIELPNGLEITSVITKTSVENLGLGKGEEVYGVIKASNVMIATED